MLAQVNGSRKTQNSCSSITFEFSLQRGTLLSLSSDLSQEKLPPFRKPESKKQSPSTLRRNTQSRKDYLAKKAALKQADDQHVELEATKTELKCDHGEEIFTAKDILNNHIAEKHFVIGTYDDCDRKTSNYENTIEHKKDERIEQLEQCSDV